MYVSDGILILLGSFLLGSAPTGVLLAKAFRLPDPRTIGSGNIGATNMLRTGNKKVALATLLLDAGKGAAAVLLAIAYDQSRALGTPLIAIPNPQWFGGLNSALIWPPLAMLGALLGHCYTPWLKFKGGKGVATYLGGLAALNGWLLLLFAAMWLLTFRMSRYVSLASIFAMASVPLLLSATRMAGLLPQLPHTLAPYLFSPVILLLALASAVGIWRHRENIRRLRTGTESKMVKKI